jgi:hypothetical protein
MGTFAAKLVAFLFIGSFGLADDKEDLANASKKATEMTSYSFSSHIEIEGGPVPMDFEFNGKYSKETATHVQGEAMGRDFEVYKQGEKVAIKREGEWSLESGARRGGMREMERAVPHEELKEIDKKFKEVKKSASKERVGEKECSVYEGELSEKAVKEMIPMGRGMGAMENAEISGSAKLWIDEEGVIRKYEMSVNMNLDFQGNQLEMKILRSTELSGIGDTIVEIPSEVTSLLSKDEKSEDKEKTDKEQKDKEEEENP